MSNTDQIYIIVEEAITEETTTVEGTRDGRTDTGGGFGTEPRRRSIEAVTQTLTRRRVGLNVGQLKQQMQDLLGVVNELFEPAEPTGDLSASPQPNTTAAQGLQLEEVTLSVEVSAEGNLSLLGTGGKLGGSGGITLTFARPKP